MNKQTTFLLALCCLLHFSISAQNKEDRNGNLVGKLTKVDFMQGKFKSWFSPEFDAYAPNEKVLKKSEKILMVSDKDIHGNVVS